MLKTLSILSEIQSNKNVDNVNNEVVRSKNRSGSCKFLTKSNKSNNAKSGI